MTMLATTRLKTKPNEITKRTKKTSDACPMMKSLMNLFLVATTSLMTSSVATNLKPAVRHDFDDMRYLYEDH